MSQEAAQALVDRVNDDETFRDELIAAGDRDARLQMAQNAGFDVTADDFTELVRQQPGSEELSEEDLEKIAGGGATTAATVLGSGMMIGSIVTAAMLV